MSLFQLCVILNRNNVVNKISDENLKLPFFFFFFAEKCEKHLLKTLRFFFLETLQCIFIQFYI